MPTQNSTTHWPAFIIAIVAAFAAFSWWSIDRALSDVSAVSDPEYYAHGLKYHSADLDLQTAATTGWTFSPLLKGQTLKITVLDAQNNRITGGQAILTFPAGQDAGGSIAPLTLTELGEGNYSATLPSGLPSSVSATLTLSKGDASTQRQILINQGS